MFAVGSLGVTAGYLRGLYGMLTRPDRKGDIAAPVMQPREPLLLALIMVLLMVAIVVTGIYPAILIDLLEPFISGLTLPAWQP